MDSQMVHPHDSHIHNQDPHNYVAHAEVDEHHQEKPSVMNKVKAKAKKIKDTLTKHGHGHNHDHDHDHDYNYHHDGHIPDDHDLDEEDDKVEEIAEDPEVHGAPTYDSSVIKTGGLEGITEAPVSTVERSTAMPHGDPLASKEVPKAPVNTPVSSFSHAVYENKESSDPTRTFVSWSDVNSGESKVNLERPKGLEEDPHATKDVRHQAYSTPSNYQTKVGDPTGAGTEEVGVAPILGSFDRMNIDDESEPFLSNPSNTPPQNPQEMEENLVDNTRNRNDRAASGNKNTFASNPTSYTDKILPATVVITDKAISAKNAVASKLGYGGKDSTETHDQTNAYGSGDGTAKPSSATVTEKPTPVYEKVAGAGTKVMSKMLGSGTGNEQVNNAKGQDKRVSVKDYVAEKLRPGDEDRALSEVISDALHKRKLDTEKKADDQPLPMGKVTQSEEVTRRLGTGDEKAEKEREETVAGYVNRPEEDGGGNGKGMVDKITGAVGSLFGFGGGDQSSQTSQSSHVGGEQGYSASAGGETGHSSDGKDEHRLQESGN